MEVSNVLDRRGAYKEADALTSIGLRVAQFDDDFGGFDDYSDSDRMSELEGVDDYNRHEENELARDRMYEDSEDDSPLGNGFPDLETAVHEIEQRESMSMASNKAGWLVLKYPDDEWYYIASEDPYDPEYANLAHAPGIEIVKRVPPSEHAHDAKERFETGFPSDTPLGLEDHLD